MIAALTDGMNGAPSSIPVFWVDCVNEIIGKLEYKGCMNKFGNYLTHILNNNNEKKKLNTFSHTHTRACMCNIYI